MGLHVKAAVKTAHGCDMTSIDSAFREIRLLCLSRDLILNTTVKVYGVAAVPDDINPEMGHLVVITEAGLMNAFQLYQRETIPLHVTYDIWSHLAAALHCIHTKGIIHQDLKPENILVTEIFRDAEDQISKVKVKIIDMGMAQLMEGPEIKDFEYIRGTCGYHSPEMLLNNSYDERSDIFLLGITFSVLMLPVSSRKTRIFQPLMNSLHEAKRKGSAGPDLFNNFIRPLVSNVSTLSSTIISMICTMLEVVEKRTITLLQVFGMCQTASSTLRTQMNEGRRRVECHESFQTERQSGPVHVAEKRGTNQQKDDCNEDVTKKTKVESAQHKEPNKNKNDLTIRVRSPKGTCTITDLKHENTLEDLLTILKEKGYLYAFKLMQMHPKRDLMTLDKATSLKDLNFTWREILIIEPIPQHKV